MAHVKLRFRLPLFIRTGLGLAFAALLLIAPLFGASAWAQEAETAPPIAPAHVDAAQLDILFPQLANAKSQAEARVFADQIWQVWLNPTTPELADRMDRIAAARTVGSYQRAIEMLSNVIEEYPDYAEAWNQRATLYFFLGDYESSLADVEQTLAREPRHFGALSGQAVIYLRLGEEFLARQAILEALKYHPFLNERSLFPELFDRPTQT